MSDFKIADNVFFIDCLRYILNHQCPMHCSFNRWPISVDLYLKNIEINTNFIIHKIMLKHFGSTTQMLNTRANLDITTATRWRFYIKTQVIALHSFAVAQLQKLPLWTPLLDVRTCSLPTPQSPQRHFRIVMCMVCLTASNTVRTRLYDKIIKLRY